jgi:hypothetical protein
MIRHSGGSEGNHDGQRHPPVVTDDEVVPKREERKKLAHQSIPLTRSDIGDRGIGARRLNRATSASA